MNRLLGICVLLASAACASRLPDMPSNASVGARSVLGTPRVEANAAAPKILTMRFSTLDVHRGSTWSGQFLTGTNVASVEVRTSLFSIDVPRTDYGRFAFKVNVLDVPPIFIRPYRLRVLARNSAGAIDEEDLPMWIR